MLLNSVFKHASRNHDVSCVKKTGTVLCYYCKLDIFFLEKEVYVKKCKFSLLKWSVSRAKSSKHHVFIIVLFKQSVLQDKYKALGSNLIPITWHCLLHNSTLKKFVTLRAVNTENWCKSCHEIETATAQ